MADEDNGWEEEVIDRWGKRFGYCHEDRAGIGEGERWDWIFENAGRRI